MTSMKPAARRSGLFGGLGAGLLVYAITGLLALSGILGLAACKQEPDSASNRDDLKTATIRVIAGNGRLAGGEEYEIGEWRSGTLSAGGGAFADFRGQDGGPTLDLSLRGLGVQGEFACGETLAASLELRVDVNNVYRASPDAPCRVAVERLEGGVIEGRYTATLRHEGNPRDEMTVAGTFRATQPDAHPARAGEIKAAKAPKIGL